MRASLIVTLIVVALLGVALLTVVAEANGLRADSERQSNKDRAVLEEQRAQLDELQRERNRLRNTNAALAEELAMIAMLESEIETKAPVVEAVDYEPELDLPEEPTIVEEPRERGRPSDEGMRQAWGEMRGRMQAAMDERFAAIEDPTSIERLNALNEWQEYQNELRQEMRDAETDEEREAIAGEMQDARTTAQQIVDDEQSALLASLAEDYNVDNLDQFTSALQETLDNPFFTMERMLVGGGRGGSRGR